MAPRHKAQPPSARAQGDTGADSSAGGGDGPRSRTSMRGKLAAVGLEEQRAMLQPPRADAPVQKKTDGGGDGGGLQSERFRSCPLFERVLAGDVLLRFGCADPTAVEILQDALTDFGFDPGPVDGIWGQLTNGGVLRFQGANGLGADGVIGPQTMGALDSAQPSPAPPDTGEEPIPDEVDAESFDLDLLQSFLGLDESSGSEAVPIIDAVFDQLSFSGSDEVHEFMGSSFGGQQSAGPSDQDQRKAELLKRVKDAFNNVYVKGYPKGKYQDAPPDIQTAEIRLHDRGLTKDESKWLYDYSLLYGAYIIMWSKQYAKDTNQKLDPKRDDIVINALGAVGKVEAHENSKQKDGGIELCIGAADYEAIVVGAGGGSKWRKEWADHRLNTNKNLTQSPYRKGIDFKQSWCQYFTGWARKMAGASQKGAPKPADGIYQPKPGDTGYREKNDLGNRVDHEGIVISCDGQNVVSVDGNVDPKSNILVRYHPVTWWDFFYETFQD